MSGLHTEQDGHDMLRNFDRPSLDLTWPRAVTTPLAPPYAPPEGPLTTHRPARSGERGCLLRYQYWLLRHQYRPCGHRISCEVALFGRRPA